MGIEAEDAEWPRRIIALPQGEPGPFLDGVIPSIPGEELSSFSDSRIAALPDGLAGIRAAFLRLVAGTAVRQECLVYE